MAKLEFIKNRIVDKFSYEWPVGSILRQIKEFRDGRREILNTRVTVVGYKAYCISSECKGCHSKGRVLVGDTISDRRTEFCDRRTEFCVGLSNGGDQSATYWEEDV